MITNDLVHGPTAGISARALLDAEAYIVDFKKMFPWKSGIKAPVYTDCRRINLHPGPRAIIKKALGTAILANFPLAEIVIGVAEAGVVWSILAADEIALQHAFVRKSIKDHGPQAGKAVECNPHYGLRAVIVDDLLASGGSVAKAIRSLRTERQMDVLGVLTIVNWDFLESREEFERENIPLRALVSYPQIIDEALSRGLIDVQQRQALSEFYQNPRTYLWPPLKASENIVGAA